MQYIYKGIDNYCVQNQSSHDSNIYTGILCTFVHCGIHQREQVLFAMMATPWSNCKSSYTSGRKETATTDDAANQISQFMIEEILLTKINGLEMEAKSYQKEEKQSSQLTLLFDFKIQFNQYHM